MLEDVDLVHELELVAGDEACPIDQIRGADRARTRPQVRDGDRTGLLRVVDEVALNRAVRFLADDLDGVLVGADRTVGAQAVEDGRGYVIRLCPKRWVRRQRQMRHIVNDAKCEVAAGSLAGELVEDGLHHRRCEFLRRQTVASGDDAGLGVER